MKNRYRVFRRGWGTYYCEDLVTHKQESLKTRDKGKAYRLVAARNEHESAPAFSLHLARVYWQAGDPVAAKRTWQHVMEEIPKLKTGETKNRWLTAIKDQALNSIRNQIVLETRAEHFLKVLADGSVSTNIYLRRIHNFAMDMSWLPWPVLPKKRWPVIKFKDKRGITLAEHLAIVARELNPERRAFYRLAWHFGASQSDIAFLEAENVDWQNHVISYARKKTGSIAVMRFDDDVAEILRDLPGSGPLFPYLRTVRAGDRATEFHQRCVGLGIKGVSLHSYRYAWAERAKTAGYAMALHGMPREPDEEITEMKRLDTSGDYQLVLMKYYEKSKKDTETRLLSFPLVTERINDFLDKSLKITPCEDPPTDSQIAQAKDATGCSKIDTGNHLLGRSRFSFRPYLVLRLFRICLCR